MAGVVEKSSDSEENVEVKSNGIAENTVDTEVKEDMGDAEPSVAIPQKRPRGRPKGSSKKKVIKVKVPGRGRGRPRKLEVIGPQVELTDKEVEDHSD